MNNKIIYALVLVSTFLLANNAFAEGKTLQEKLEQGSITITADIMGCDEDTKTYCKGLDPSSQKAMLCMIAFEDMLSKQCKLGISEAALTLEMGKAALDYSIESCEADADKFCLDVKPGKGRIIGCLKKNEKKIGKACVTALKETGFWEMAGK